jgi:hypothetical protein
MASNPNVLALLEEMLESGRTPEEVCRKTASSGSSKAAEAYRQTQAALIAKGKLREAIQMDINDTRGKFGTKYDARIEEMLRSFGFPE